MREKMNQWRNKDIFYAADFVVNIVLIILVMTYYRKLYLNINPANFMYEVIMAGSGIFMIGGMASIVCAVIELFYGITKIRGIPFIKNIEQWPVMWAIIKCLLLISCFFAVLMGVDLGSFFDLR